MIMIPLLVSLENEQYTSKGVYGKIYPLFEICDFCLSEKNTVGSESYDELAGRVECLVCY